MTIAILMILFFGMAFPQAPAKGNPMDTVAFLEGRWQGTGTG